MGVIFYGREIHTQRKTERDRERQRETQTQTQRHICILCVCERERYITVRYKATCKLTLTPKHNQPLNPSMGTIRFTQPTPTKITGNY
jgi:hypothetical protein